MGIRVGQVAYDAGPHTKGAPDNLEAVIVDFFNQAQKRLEIAPQELENEPIAQAIISVRPRKVPVKLVIEQRCFKHPPKPDSRSPKKSKHEPCRVVHDAILNTNRWHHTFIVRDRKAVLTSPTKLIPTGTHRNFNRVVIVAGPVVDKLYARECLESQAGWFSMAYK
ncbi:MAG: phospholipase D-like domain-containing protein [Candidatus Thiodiazotropha endolucinida]